MRLTNRIGKKLNPKTGREVIASVVVDVDTTPIRRPQLHFFVATEPMEIATDLGLVEISEGDYVTVSETGQIKTYTEEAFKRAFVGGSAPAEGGSAAAAAADPESRNRLDILEGQIRNVNNFQTDLGTRLARLESDAAAAAAIRATVPRTP